MTGMQTFGIHPLPPPPPLPAGRTQVMVPPAPRLPIRSGPQAGKALREAASSRAFWFDFLAECVEMAASLCHTLSGFALHVLLY